MFHLVRGVFTSFFLYTGLVTMFTYIVLIFDIFMMMYVFFTYLYICCFFSIFIHMFFILVCNLLFLFHTKMLWWVLFKVFQKYKLSKSTCHKLSSCKVFQEFVLGYILLYSTIEYKLSDLWLISYFICLLWFCHRIAKVGDC